MDAGQVLEISSGQSHLILGTGFTSDVRTSQLSKHCCIRALYKALANGDAIALCPVSPVGDPTRREEGHSCRRPMSHCPPLFQGRIRGGHEPSSSAFSLQAL